MTVTDESTSRVADSPPAAPSFFQRICCCCSSDIKEPPVQLIRSGSLTYQQGAAVTSAAPESSSSVVISAAKKSVDDDVPKPQSSTLKEPDAESVNMNDLMMENVLKRTTEEDRTEAVEEDNVSISTNVVQEIDENELRKALTKAGNNANEVPKLKGRSGISKGIPSESEESEDEEHADNRRISVAEFLQEGVLESSYSSPPLPPVIPNQNHQNEKMSEATQSEMSDSEDEVSSDAAKQINTVGMSSKTTARAEKNSDSEQHQVFREFRELSSDESLKGSLEDEEDEEEGQIRANREEEEEEVPPPLPSSPPPRLSTSQNAYGQLEGSPIPPPRSPQRRSLMYANADDSDSDDSEDEVIEEAHPNGLVRMHPVNFAAQPKDDDQQSISSESSVVSTASDLSEKENDDEETTLGVTRISVKSDGRAEIHSPKSPVRVTLEPDRNEVTDDDFSEKLI